MATITTNPASLLSAASTASPLQPNKAQQQKSQFLQLLVAQLKGQNPLDPKDGTEFVSQLAQFSSLEELINIRTVLEESAKASAAAASTSNPFKGEN